MHSAEVIQSGSAWQSSVQGLWSFWPLVHNTSIQQLDRQHFKYLKIERYAFWISKGVWGVTRDPQTHRIKSNSLRKVDKRWLKYFPNWSIDYVHCMLEVSWPSAIVLTENTTQSKMPTVWGWLGVSGPSGRWKTKYRPPHTVSKSGSGCALWSALLSVHLSLYATTPYPRLPFPISV